MRTELRQYTSRFAAGQIDDGFSSGLTAAHDFQNAMAAASARRFSVRGYLCEKLEFVTPRGLLNAIRRASKAGARRGV